MQNSIFKSIILKLIVLLTFLVILPISSAISEGVILKPKIAGMNAENLLPDNAKSIGNGLYVVSEGPEDPRFAAQKNGAHPCEKYIDLIKQGLFDCEADIKLYALNTPNDPSFGSLWGMNKIDAEQAWDLSTGSQEVVVGVIDTGIDYTHPDLAENMWRNPYEVAGNGIDDDGNGVVDDVFGYNAIDQSGDPMDDNSHGTHCAGTIGGVGNNGNGVAGVAWNVKMIGAKFLSANGSGSLSGAIRAIDYLTNLKTNQGVNIVLTNNSWGGGGYSQFLRDAIERHRQAGIIFVAAAGNSSNNNDSLASYPASYDLDNVISVAATDSNDNLASFSNYGATSVDIAAPGVGILSTIHANRYASYSGTSMAAPHVSGAIALLKSYTNLSMSNLISRVYNTGDSLSQLNGIVRTGKRLNVNNMLRNDESDSPPPPTDGGENCSYSATKLNSFIGLSPTQITSLPLIAAEKDEFYERVNIPVEFYDEQLTNTFVSPNGVVYFSDIPRNDMDYKIDSGVSSRSLSVFHSDLVSDIYAGQDSQGRSVIGFRSVPFTNKNEDYTYISLIHVGNGSFIASFTKPAGADFGNTLMGIKGETAASEVEHYKGPSATLADSYSVRYTLNCSSNGDGDNGNTDEESIINNFKVRYKTKNRLLRRNNIRRRASSVARLIIKHNPTPDNIYEEVNIKIGNTTCNETVMLNLKSNKGRSTIFVPTFRRGANTELSVTKNPSLSATIRNGNKRRRRRRRRRRATFNVKNRDMTINNTRKCARFSKLINSLNN